MYAGKVGLGEAWRCLCGVMGNHSKSRCPPLPQGWGGHNQSLGPHLWKCILGISGFEIIKFTYIDMFVDIFYKKVWNNKGN